MTKVPPKELTRKLMRSLWFLEATICVIGFSISAGILMADVLGRELLGQPIFGAQRVAVWTTAIAGLIGFALVTAENGHLRPRLFDNLIPGSIDTGFNRVADLVSATLCIGLGWYAMDFVKSSALLGERGVAIPILVWPIQAVLPWMFFSSAARHIAFAIWQDLKPSPTQEH